MNNDQTSQHTPGPWVTDSDGVDSPSNMAECLINDAGSDREWVAVGIKDEDGYAESVAYCHPKNADLISASTDMLEALLACVEPTEPGEDCPLPAALYNKVCAAIAKAQGRAK